MKSGYFGFLPINIRHNKNLKPLSKLLFCEITASLEEDGMCTKRNIYFSKIMDISKPYVSRCLKELRDNGFVHVEILLEEGTQKFIKRYITPIPTGNGVNPITSHTYIPTVNGVGDFNEGEGLLTPNTTGKTLLYNNNINKSYTNKQANNTPINKSINDEQLKYIKEIVNSFYKRQSEKFPHLYINWQDDNDLINKSVNEIYDLIKIDSVDYKLIKQVIDWATIDRFWHKSLVSLKTLRRKSENGFTKWNNILTNYRSKLQ